jgi:hypothetical protein
MLNIAYCLEMKDKSNLIIDDNKSPASACDSTDYLDFRSHLDMILIYGVSGYLNFF